MSVQLKSGVLRFSWSLSYYGDMQKGYIAHYVTCLESTNDMSPQFYVAIAGYDHRSVEHFDAH